MLQLGTKDRLCIFPAHRSPRKAPDPSAGPAAPGDAARLPPFSRWLFSTQALPEIACALRAAGDANSSPPETEEAVLSEHHPPCAFHPPECLSASSSVQKSSACPRTPLLAGEPGCTWVCCVLDQGICSFAARADRQLAQPRVSHVPPGKGGWWLPGAGQVAQGTQHMSLLPRWPGTAVPSCRTLPHVPSYTFIVPA